MSIDICVIYASENEAIAKELVIILRESWQVWSAGDIVQGDWEEQVRSCIKASKAIVPLISFQSVKKTIFRDELQLAADEKKPIFPFFIDDVTPPLGFGYLNRTEAFGWNGDVDSQGYKQLEHKLIKELGQHKSCQRKLTLDIGRKVLRLPCFMFSLSSHETPVTPKDGLRLFQLLKPSSAGLISAYDVWKYKEDNILYDEFLDTLRGLRESSCTLVLDSGNYEGYRKNDLYSTSNKNGWKKEIFRELSVEVSPDLAFHFDEISPDGTIEEIADRVVTTYKEDLEAIEPEFPLCPIIHLPEKLPEKFSDNLSEFASELVARIACDLNPVMVAIPERELGEGILQRVRVVCDIRKALNSLGKYYPLHLLGAGNPISIKAFASAGADSFDGLEWCRTVTDYSNGYLFHFSQFDLFRERCLSQLQSQEIRRIIENPDAPYVTKVLSYNLDFFSDWIKTIQDMIAARQEEHLLKTIPNVGNVFIKEVMSS